ncbi:hypothetical protein BH11PSE13_BH11PSE13_12200 [soil metagenome]
MGYIALHTLTVGLPAVKENGKQTRASTLKTIQAGEPVPKLDKDEYARLVALGAIVDAKPRSEPDSTTAQDKEKAEAEAKQRLEAEAREKAESEERAKAEADRLKAIGQ